MSMTVCMCVCNYKSIAPARQPPKEIECCCVCRRDKEDTNPVAPERSLRVSKVQEVASSETIGFSTVHAPVTCVLQDPTSFVQDSILSLAVHICNRCTVEVASHTQKFQLCEFSRPSQIYRGPIADAV